MRKFGTAGAVLIGALFALLAVVAGAATTAVTAPYKYPQVTWGPLTAGQPYSLTTDGDQTFTFQTKGYDRWTEPTGYSDGPNIIRSEVYGPYFAPGVMVEFNYRVTLAPGPISTNAWLLLGQIHSPNDIVGSSPVVSLNVLPDAKSPTGETLYVNHNYQVNGGPFVYDVLASTPFYRGVSHAVSIRFRDSRGLPGGYINVTYDYVTLANFVGVTGYYGATTLCYAKYGLYLGGHNGVSSAIPDSGQTLTATYKNPTFVVLP